MVPSEFSSKGTHSPGRDIPFFVSGQEGLESGLLVKGSQRLPRKQLEWGAVQVDYKGAKWTEACFRFSCISQNIYSLVGTQ